VMGVAVEERGDWLNYRICWDGWKAREATGCKATDRNRQALQKKADAMNALMAEGNFRYLQWFPEGTQRHRYAPPEPAPTPATPPVRAYAEETWLPRMTPPAIRRSLEETYRSGLRAHILPAFGDMHLDAINRGVLLDFRGEMIGRKPKGKGLKMKTA